MTVIIVILWAVDYIHMKIVILDHPRENPGEIDWSGFEKFGEVVKYPRTQECDVVERIGDADVVFLNKTVVTREALEKCPNLKFTKLATVPNLIN